jgi:endo-1,4-beta-xylanase
MVGFSKIQYTEPIPKDYFTEVFEGGTVVVIEYDTLDYVNNNSRLCRKHANVYLPNGFVESKSYHFLYLLHGWTGNAEDFINDKVCQLKSLLDHMIADHIIPPIIVVSPTWDRDNEEKEWEESCLEVKNFWKEYCYHLVPAIEGLLCKGYDNNLRTNWQYRSVGGFSLGAIATWYIFQNCFGMQKNYVPMSGECWDKDESIVTNNTFDTIKLIIENSGYKDDEFRIYNAIGTRDSRYKEVSTQSELFQSLNEVKSNCFQYYVKEGGYHSYISAYEYLCNILPKMLKTNQNKNYLYF